MSTLIELNACVLDLLTEQQLMPECIMVQPNRVELTFNFDDLSAEERIKVKRLVKEKFKKSDWNNNIWALKHDFAFGFFESVPMIADLRVEITAAYECKQVCTPKHHTKADEQAFIEDDPIETERRAYVAHRIASSPVE